MRGYFGIGLENVKTPPNIGGVLRAAECYGAAFVSLSGHRYQRSCTNTTKTERHIPLYHALDQIDAYRPYDCPMVVIELAEGAVSLPDFTHPERAFYVFGPEDGSVSKAITAKAQHVVSVPTRHCMNLAACANVVLYDRMAKQLARPSVRRVA